MHTDAKYSQRRWDDSLTESGARALANTIKIFWLKQGKTPSIRFVKESVANAEGGAGLYCIRSDMKNGRPA